LDQDENAFFSKGDYNAFGMAQVSKPDGGYIELVRWRLAGADRNSLTQSIRQLNNGYDAVPWQMLIPAMAKPDIKEMEF
jgi:hypothetical protein